MVNPLAPHLSISLITACMLIIIKGAYDWVDTIKGMGKAVLTHRKRGQGMGRDEFGGYHDVITAAGGCRRGMFPLPRVARKL